MPILAAGALSCAAALPLNWLLIFKTGWGLHGSIPATAAVEGTLFLVLLASALVLSAAAPPEERCVGCMGRPWGQRRSKCWRASHVAALSAQFDCAQEPAWLHSACRPLTGFRREALQSWGTHLRVAVPAALLVMVEWWVLEE